MSLDWNSLLSSGVLETFPLLIRIFTAPFILYTMVFGIIGGLIFKNKEGVSLGAFVGVLIAINL